ncbi:hypothetical protein ACFVGV_06005 [Pseudarthrobacter scleromae]|uniref:hypothetical protein n=1 Tax=Pseudarthrobacter scleromae TaxID=158897 RepID=UPI00362F0447
MTTTTTDELVAAAEAYTNAMHTWIKVHLAWSKGEATIEQDRAADEARRAALAEVQRIEAIIKPKYGNKKQYQDQEAEAYDPYDHEAAANDLG